MTTRAVFVTMLALAIAMSVDFVHPNLAAGQVTFGDTAIESSQSSLGNNQAALLRVSVPSSGTITKLTVYTARASGSPVLTGLVYADNNGTVAGLLGRSSEVAVTQSSPAWLDLPGLNVPTSPGYVWIGVMVGPSSPSSAAAFWLNFSANGFQLDANISLTYPNAPATVVGYSAYPHTAFSLTGTLGNATTSPLSVSVTPGSATLQSGSGGLTTSTNVGLPLFDATDVDSRGNVFAAYNYGVYKSTDRGATFSLVYTIPTQPGGDDFSGMIGHGWALYIDSRDYIFVSIVSTNRLYRSSNGGASFQEVLNLNRPYMDGSIINMAEDEQGSLYAAEYGNSQTGARLFRSTSGGAAGSWVSLRNFAARHLHNVKMNPNNNWLYVAVGEPGGNTNGLGSADTKKVFRSTDHGATWTQVAQGSGSGFVAMSFYGNWVVLGEDNGGAYSNIVRFQDTGLNQVYALQTVWANPSVSMVYGGTNLGNYMLMATGREGVTGVLNVLASTDSVNWTSVFSATGTTRTDDHRALLTVHPNRGGVAFTALASGARASFTVGTAATFTATAAGGAPPYNIRWFNNTGSLLGTGNSYAFTPTAAGTYLIYASVTDAAQVTSTSNFVTITVNGTGTSARTVTFNANGGTGTMSSQTASSPTALRLNAFTRTGYTFIGWNTAANGGGASYADGASYSFAADVTLYAQWTSAISSRTVTFNANGGTGTMSSQTASSPTALRLNAFTRTGYTFIGWNTAANGGGASYGDGATYSFAADATLYAQWTSSGTGVTFGDGVVEPTRSSVSSSQMALLRVPVPSSGTIRKLSVYTARESGAPVVIGTVYADNNGVVAGLLGQTSEVAVSQTSPAWLDLPGLNIPVNAGYVWIGVMVGPSATSSSAAFWINVSGSAYQLNYSIPVAYPAAPAVVTSYATLSNVGWSIIGSF